MSRREDRVRLRHMLDHAREAEEMSRSRQRVDLDNDRMLELALVRLLEIVGEAANRISGQTRERFGAIAWADIIGLRNRVIHGYDRVDHDILWDILRDDLPPLIEQLENALRRLDADDRNHPSR
jgi:uncharacterized protein with HEPN domain